MSNLLDTDWAIHYLNGNSQVMRRLDSLRPDGISISIVSMAELYEGIVNSSNPEDDERELADFLQPFPLINLNLAICRIFGTERARLRAAGNSSRTWTCSSALPPCATTSPCSPTTGAISSGCRASTSSPPSRHRSTSSAFIAAKSGKCARPAHCAWGHVYRKVRNLSMSFPT